MPPAVRQPLRRCLCRLAVLTGLTVSLLAVAPGLLPAASATTPPSTLTLTTTLRDFEYHGTPVHSTTTNPDFQFYSAGLVTGLVQSTLGASGVPVLQSTGAPNQQSITSADSLAQWFTDVPGTNVTLTQPLTLSETSPNVYQYASSKYYPLDGLGWNDPTYGTNPQTDHDCNDLLNHNFSFTQAIHALFTYHAGSSPTFSVQGDDDIWVFINNDLAIDLGGVHSTASGSVTLDAAHASQLGLVDGHVYPIDLFNAERHTCASDFTLTVSGFDFVPKPTVDVTGVSDGATYEYGQVPAAGCSASSVDGTTTPSPALSTPTAGDGTGQQTATCSYTDSAGQSATASATYTIVDTTPPVVSISVPTTVEATGPDTAVSLDASAVDVHDGTVPATCTLDNANEVTPGNDMELPVGQHAIDCASTDAHGNTGTAHADVTVTDTTAPSLPPLSNEFLTFGPDGTVAATYPQPSDATDLVDGTDPVGCTPLSGETVLTSSSPTVLVTCSATDQAGNFTSAQFTITGEPPADTVPPLVHLTSLPTATTNASVPLRWSASDAGSGVATYDVRWRRATFSTGFGSWRYPSSWQRTSATRASLSVAAGDDYCVSMRARDVAGNVSRWSPSTCVARALDDRALSRATTGWVRRTGSVFYEHTVTHTSGYHRSLTLSGVQLDRLGLVVTTCASCGRVALYVGSRLIGKLDLRSARVRHRLLMLPRFAYRRGKVTVKTLSSGKTVDVDGLVVSRT